jgi:hypothetical protein
MDPVSMMLSSSDFASCKCDQPVRLELVHGLIPGQGPSLVDLSHQGLGWMGKDEGCSRNSLQDQVTVWQVTSRKVKEIVIQAEFVPVGA